MSRYIEYHDICSAICNQQDGTGMTYEALAHAMVEIQLAPSIDIVRCGACKKRKKNCFCLEHMRYEKNDKGFCSYGSRSEKPNNSERSSDVHNDKRNGHINNL